MEWRNLGVFTAFIVALFAEMYGFPLTIYLLTGVAGLGLGTPTPFGHLDGHLLATLLGLPIWAALMCLVGGLIMGGGLLVMWRGWQQVHAGHGELVTGGVYERVRHPQYAGLFLITIGMLVQKLVLAGPRRCVLLDACQDAREPRESWESREPWEPWRVLWTGCGGS